MQGLLQWDTNQRTPVLPDSQCRQLVLLRPLDRSELPGRPHSAGPRTNSVLYGTAKVCQCGHTSDHRRYSWRYAGLYAMTELRHIEM